MTAGQNRAVVEDVRAIRDRQGFPDVVIGHQDPHPPRAQRLDQVLEISHRKGIHPCEGFIQEQVAGAFRSHSQGPGHFTAASLAT